MDKYKINGAIGEVLCKEKYKWLPNGLVGEIIRDFLEELNSQGENQKEYNGLEGLRPTTDLNLEGSSPDIHSEIKSEVDKDYAKNTENEEVKR